MRKLLGRLFSQSDEKVADGAARDGETGGSVAGIAVEIDMAFYRWLTASAAYNAPTEIDLGKLSNLDGFA